MFDAQLTKTFTDVKTGIRVICELSEHCMCNVSCASNHADTRLSCCPVRQKLTRGGYNLLIGS